MTGRVGARSQQELRCVSGRFRHAGTSPRLAGAGALAGGWETAKVESSVAPVDSGAQA